MKEETVDCTIIGIDIGGSHITAAIVDLANRRVLPESMVRKHINSAGEAEEILNGWIDVIAAVRKSIPNQPIKVGIAMPGPFDYENGICFIRNMNKYESLYGLNIRDALAEKLGIDGSAIMFRNDAESYLAGEVLGGTGRGQRKILGLTFGTGLGSAVCDHGVTRDVNLGSSPFRDGIAEDYLSTRWFVEAYASLSGLHIANVKELTQQIGNNKSALLVMKAFACNLTDFLVDFSKREDPDVIVLGGNISKAHRLFLPEVERLLQEKAIRVTIEMAKLGEAAALLGATACWQKQSERALR